MLKKFFITLFVSFFLFFQTFADTASYKKYIESRAGTVVQQKTLEEKIDILVKVNMLLLEYQSQENLSHKENEIAMFLTALEEYLRENIAKKSNSVEGKIVIRIIDDERCNDCQTDMMVDELENLPFLSHATFVREDFLDPGIQEYLEDNSISYLPAIIFNTKQIDDGGQITPYLFTLPDGNYSLAVGASFDPYEERSKRGFKIVNQDIIDDLLGDAHMFGSSSAEVTWIEYSDLECPFCARLHNEKVLDEVLKEFGTKVNYTLQHFPLDFHTNALNAAQALECITEQKEAAYYPVIEASFETYSSNNFSLSGFYTIAEENGIHREDLETCVENGEYEQKVREQMKRGQEVFHISGTPGNVLINTITGEYMVIPGAYPYESFKKAINSLLR